MRKEEGEKPNRRQHLKGLSGWSEGKRKLCFARVSPHQPRGTAAYCSIEGLKQRHLVLTACCESLLVTTKASLSSVTFLACNLTPELLPVAQNRTRHDYLSPVRV
ncbi:hypothetical protein E2C01_042942 [Portunus trituberculatus]|uniref:Uncharacterized protein n=1 Tax=Portunus trituberculatus TaxID=210409 RepID=A0A5B7FUR6_PORTR|nr:hypothetical protein [Portunus trituberculatus]